MRPVGAPRTAADPPPEPVDPIELGAVRGAYGVKGWLRIAPFDAEATVLRAVRRWWLRDRSGRWTGVDVAAVRRHGAILLARWEGWDSPEAANCIRGAVVGVPRTLFPPLAEGEYYWVDLIGATVVNLQRRTLGKVFAVRDNGAHQLIEVRGEAQSLIPLVPAYVERVDTVARLITVDWQPEWSR